MRQVEVFIQGWLARFRTPHKPSLCESEESKKFLFAFLPSLILKVPVSAKAMSEKRFVIQDSSVEEYAESLENENTQGKTKRDGKLLKKGRARVVSNYSRGPRQISSRIYSLCQT